MMPFEMVPLEQPQREDNRPEGDRMMAERLSEERLAEIRRESESTIRWRESQEYQSGHKTHDDTIVELCDELSRVTAERGALQKRVDELEGAIREHRDQGPPLSVQFDFDERLWSHIESTEGK